MVFRLFGCLTLVVVGVIVVAIHPLLLNLVGSSLVVDEPLRPADVVVVLAGGSPYRVQHAEELYREGWAKHVAISDEVVATHGFQSTWSSLYAQGLARIDLPAEAVTILPEIALDTLHEARMTRDLMRQRGWKRAIVVTDPYHSRRAALIFQATLQAAELEVRSSPALNSPSASARWWTSDDGIQRVVVEYLKVLWVFVTTEGRFAAIG